MCIYCSKDEDDDDDDDCATTLSSLYEYDSCRLRRD